MKRKQNHYVLSFAGVGFVFAWAAIIFGINTSYAFTLGKTYDSSNWQEMENIAPPFLVNWVKKGDFVLKTGTVNFDFEFEKDFLQASQKNLGKFDFNEKGFIVENETRERPNFIYGLPFPSISFQDEKAGQKIMTNNLFGYLRLGGYVMPYGVIFVGKKGKEREIDNLGKFLLYQGRPGGPIQNTDNFQYQFVTVVVSPMDMKGTVMLFWEYDDDRLGTCFNYISMMRRISRATPNTRSNPFLGSDMCTDDTRLWIGKNHSFNWKLIGEKEILCGFLCPDKIMVRDLPDGSVNLETVKVQLGFENPNWKGAPWAPLNVIWSPRTVWVVEGMPKDPEYNSGRQLFYVDKDTFTIWFKEMYQRSGQYWKGLFAVQSFQVAPSGKNNLLHADFYGAVDENKQHASYAQQLDSAAGLKNVIYCPESALSPKDFTVGAAQELTK